MQLQTKLERKSCSIPVRFWLPAAHISEQQLFSEMRLCLCEAGGSVSKASSDAWIAFGGCPRNSSSVGVWVGSQGP
eukprot:m.56429 g.56429  ORF g.56429 m.56429 type:complete len:76 (+) comp48943_c0_seq2:104-331(+)